jgi:hypothetical protein
MGCHGQEGIRQQEVQIRPDGSAVRIGREGGIVQLVDDIADGSDVVVRGRRPSRWAAVSMTPASVWADGRSPKWSIQIGW